MRVKEIMNAFYKKKQMNDNNEYFKGLELKDPRCYTGAY